MSTPLLKIEHLEVRYGDLIGVSDVSLEVPEGSVVALLGSNGGGKTTTLNAIAGLIPVHSGSIGFRGRDIGGESAFSIVRKGLALSPEGWRLFVQQSRCGIRRAPPICSRACTTFFPGLPSAAPSGRARCRAANGRCSR
jgi:ABC-type branched-subunit amino acid transport system ATPase component